MSKASKLSTAFNDIMKAAQLLQEAGVPSQPKRVELNPEIAQHVSYTINLLSKFDGEGEFTFGNKTYRLTLEEGPQS